tara:strand:- start:1273 stop:1707 length:435 start_codon:yes stop_codon:yes gene_type:complete
MITKIKKAIVGAVLNSDTFKSTLEKSVSDEVQVFIDHNDIATCDHVDNQIRDAGYNYEYIDRDEAREIANEEIYSGEFVERDDLESDVKQYFQEFLADESNCKFVEALDAQLLQHKKRFCEQSVFALNAYLTEYVELLEKAGEE